MPSKDIWVDGIWSTAYVCNRCGDLAYYWTDDLLKHPAQSEEEYEEWYTDHKRECADNLRITKVK